MLEILWRKSQKSRNRMDVTPTLDSEKVSTKTRVCCKTEWLVCIHTKKRVERQRGGGVCRPGFAGVCLMKSTQQGSLCGVESRSLVCCVGVRSPRRDRQRRDVDCSDQKVEPCSVSGTVMVVARLRRQFSLLALSPELEQLRLQANSQF